MSLQISRGNFESDVLPHLDAAYNLARWLARNQQDAEDIVQEAFLRAFGAFAGFRGENPGAWLLKIVRNTFYTRLPQKRSQAATITFDEELHSQEGASISPEALLLKSADRELIRRALEELPPNFREVLVLRELEGLSYREISEIAGIPMGTVMSSLARARERLRQSLEGLASKSSAPEEGWEVVPSLALAEQSPK